MSYFFVLIVAILFATHEPVSKLIADETNPYVLTAIRFLIASALCLPLSLRKIAKNKLKLQWKDFLILGGLGVLDICVGKVLAQISITVSDSPALMSIIYSSNSVFTIILSTLFLKTKLSKTEFIGILICIAGVMLSVDYGSGTNLLSVALSLLSAVIFSAYVILCKKFMSEYVGSIQMGISCFIGSLVLLLILLISGVDIIGGSGISSSNILEIGYLSVIDTGFGYLLYFAVLERSGPNVVALVYLIKPVLAPFAAWIINGIVPGYNIIIAVILVVIGAALASHTIENLINAGKNKKTV